MTTRDLLTHYYEGLKQKKDWERALSDDFVFVGTGGRETEPRSRGRAGYVEVIARFSRTFSDFAVQETLVDGSQAYALVRYQLRSPKGKTMSFDIVEKWRAEGNALQSLVLYYDTATFNAFMSD